MLLGKFIDISYTAGATGLRQGVSTPTKHIEYFVVTARQWLSGYPGHPRWAGPVFAAGEMTGKLCELNVQI